MHTNRDQALLPLVLVQVVDRWYIPCKQPMCSLVPRSHPAFRRLQYGKVRESRAGPGNKANLRVLTVDVGAFKVGKFCTREAV